LPKLNASWKYAFFIDVTFEKFSDYEKAKTIVNIMAENFKILGEYKNAKL
jgi:prephenate dehydratase